MEGIGSCLDAGMSWASYLGMKHQQDVSFDQEVSCMFSGELEFEAKRLRTSSIPDDEEAGDSLPSPLRFVRIQFS